MGTKKKSKKKTPKKKMKVTVAQVVAALEYAEWVIGLSRKALKGLRPGLKMRTPAYDPRTAFLLLGGIRPGTIYDGHCREEITGTSVPRKKR
jgi:hypothetical protein